MIRRSLYPLLGSTALAVLLATSVLAQESGQAPAPAVVATPAEAAATSPAVSDLADRAEPAPRPVEAAPVAAAPAPTAPAPVAGVEPVVPAAPSASDIAATLGTPIEMPTAAPPMAAPETRAVAVEPAQPAPVARTEPATPAATPAPAVTGTATPAASTVAVTPPAAVAPPAGVASADLAQAIGVAIADLADRKGTAEQKRMRTALEAFYAARGNAPVFVDGLGLAERGRAALARFAKAGEDGLEPSDYAVKPGEAATPAELARTEAAVAEAALHYASDAMSGRFDPVRVSALVTAKPPVADFAAILAELSTAADVSATLAGYNPPHEGYRRLKAKLAELGPVERPPQQVQVPTGPSLKPGQKDARVAALRVRLGAGATTSDADTYDDGLVEAVKAFQRDNGIKATGVVGPATLTALNQPAAGKPEVKAADIVANMERWRWLPRDLGSMHVFVNIPEFQLGVVQDGREIHRTRVIVGKVQNQTPVFSHTMTHIIVNPYWNVPVSILKKEMLGKIQETGGAYLDRGNYEVVVGSRVQSASSVDWANVNPAAVRVRQRPGAGNALGNVKFMFPNEHSVYLHDTSSRGLFSQTYRALSHGCVRVHEPFAFADALLTEEPGDLDGAKLKGMIGGSERYFWLKRKVEVHLAYFTTWVAADGTLEARADIYGHNEKTKRLLGL